MTRALTFNRGQWLQIGAAVLFATILTLLLVLGIRRASELQSTSGALQLASELSSRPELMRSELADSAWPGNADLCRTIAAQTGSMRESTNRSYAVLRDNLKAAKLSSDKAISQPLREAFDRWQRLNQELGTQYHARNRAL
jgi:hypothetical protein